MKTDNKIVNKPWGYELWFTTGTESYLGKILRINPNSRLSFQYHEQKEESITVLNGTCYIIYKNIGESNLTETRLDSGDSFHIPPGMIHRFTSKDSGCTLIEVSTYHPDDLVRIQDDYDRT